MVVEENDRERLNSTTESALSNDPDVQVIVPQQTHARIELTLLLSPGFLKAWGVTAKGGNAPRR